VANLGVNGYEETTMFAKSLAEERQSISDIRHLRFLIRERETTLGEEPLHCGYDIPLKDCP
jgi:hypothetical protein